MRRKNEQPFSDLGVAGGGQKVWWTVGPVFRPRDHTPPPVSKANSIVSECGPRTDCTSKKRVVAANVYRPPQCRRVQSNTAPMKNEQESEKPIKEEQKSVVKKEKDHSKPVKKVTFADLPESSFTYAEEKRIDRLVASMVHEARWLRQLNLTEQRRSWLIYDDIPRKMRMTCRKIISERVAKQAKAQVKWTNYNEVCIILAD